MRCPIAWAACLAAALAFPARSDVPVAAEPAWSLRLAPDQRVVYGGLVNLDNAGQGAGSFMYPAPGLIGLVAAVATHGAIATSVRNAEKSRLQEAADAVIAPYRSVLDRYPDDTLASDALKQVDFAGRGEWFSTATTAREWTVDSTPVFRMTQDQAAIVLDNTVQIRPLNAAAPPLFDGTVRVVSKPLPEGAEQPQWLADEGQPLRSALSALYAQSLAIALKQATGLGTAPAEAARTVRYEEGRALRVERAQVVETRCGRWLIKNLRGWLSSVPVRTSNSDSNTACQP